MNERKNSWKVYKDILPLISVWNELPTSSRNYAGYRG